MNYTHTDYYSRKDFLKDDMALDKIDTMIDIMLDAQQKYCANRQCCNECEYFNETCDCQVVLFAEALYRAGYGFLGE